MGINYALAVRCERSSGNLRVQIRADRSIVVAEAFYSIWLLIGNVSGIGGLNFIDRAGCAIQGVYGTKRE